MAASTITKILCSNNGAMDYNELVFNIGSGFSSSNTVLQKTLENNPNFLIVTSDGKRKIIAKTKVRLCRARICDQDCNNLHLCKFFLYGDCKYNKGRRKCRFSHDMNSEQNAKVLKQNDLHELDRRELCQLLLQNDNSLLPPVCNSYNKGNGPYGNCTEQESCTRLHVCEKYIRGTCLNCTRFHNFDVAHPLKTLEERGLPKELISSVFSVYQNILSMKYDNNSKMPEKDKTEICMYYVWKDCKHGDKCNRVHFNMPYKWEVWDGVGWSHLSDNEGIEKDFCDPIKLYSSGLDRVCFDTMTKGSAKVRRLSTVSSVTQPSFVLTTEWAWYWEDESGNWIQYASSDGIHGASSITSEDLEKKYLEDKNGVVEFTAGRQTYELSFQDMIQTNKRYGTKRLVRRRPVFVSPSDAQLIRTRKKGLNKGISHDFKAVPSYWDKSSLLETGYKKILLQKSTAEYQKIENLFKKTMIGFTISRLERIQNKSLWEVFQWQKEQMKKNNARQNVNEKLLFHGTDTAYVDAICRQNFDWRICGTHGTAYGKGSYFARDAKYSHSYTGSSATKTMFVSWVLVGQYAKGSSSYLRPPSKDGGDTIFYDSCVDNIYDPSIFVVFEKHQIYPEYLVQYSEDIVQSDPLYTMYSYPNSTAVPTPQPKPRPAPSSYRNQYVNSPVHYATQSTAVPTPQPKPTPAPSTYRNPYTYVSTSPSSISDSSTTTSSVYSFSTNPPRSKPKDTCIIS
uniref:Si:ch73-252i11.1 n=1 Tax=Lepisosteus oculatus TaxID=7918 RepID=W5NI60_LEPOC|nr:PREDICTED: poly [ADP-ribose] polymerase 12-like [Lepisosteus oculatus]